MDGICVKNRSFSPLDHVFIFLSNKIYIFPFIYDLISLHYFIVKKNLKYYSFIVN